MNDKAKKHSKLRARLPRGLADRGPAELAATRRMTETIRAVYERYGFDPVETPAFEYTDALGKFLPDQDRPNEGVFSFQDDDEQWISLRYDLTAPLARYVAENYQHLALPFRSYRAGYVFRNEKPGPGRFRQFMQFDADTVGSASPAADAEMCMMAADAMEALGFSRGQYVVKVNNRKVLDGLRESLHALQEIDDGQWLTVVRTIDKADKFGISELEKLLAGGRWDGGQEGKGDFTKGAGLGTDQIKKVIGYVEWSTKGIVLNPFVDDEDDYDATTAARLQAEANGRKANDAIIGGLDLVFGSTPVAKEGLGELGVIASIADACGYSDCIRISPSVVRGLEYYTGPVFEVELLIQIPDEKGRPVRFGSVGGGGRYDGLVSRFMGQPVPATGFSIGVSRLQDALKRRDKDKPQPPMHGPVVVTVFDKNRIADYQKLVTMLRESLIDPADPSRGRIRAELYLGSPKNMGNQLKYADKRNSPCVIIQGSDELNHVSGDPHVIVKNLIVGKDVALFHSAVESQISTQEFRNDQKAQAQRVVSVGKMVDAVRALLDQHGVRWG